MFRLKKKVFVVLVMLAVLSLPACGSLEVEGEAVKAVDLTLTPSQAHRPFGLFGIGKKAIGSSKEIPIENNEAEMEGQEPAAGESNSAAPAEEVILTHTPTATYQPPTATGPTPTITATFAPPTATPFIVPATPIPTIEDAIYEESFWPTPPGGKYYDEEWDFGVRFDFSSTQETNVSFQAFGIYHDELNLFPSIVSSCMSGQIPLANMDRPLWTTGNPTTYPAGRHVHEQTFHYSGSLDGITQIVLWLVQEKNGQIVHCNVNYLQLINRTEPGIGSARFTPDTSEVDRNTEFDFGVYVELSTILPLDVMLVAFPIYGDEAAPAQGMCMNRQAQMPSEQHSDRPFWSTGSTQTFSGGKNIFTQYYTYSDPIPGSTHLALWLSFWKDGVLYQCEEKYYTFSPE